MSAKDTYGTTKRIEVLNGDLELDAKSESVKVLGTTNATSISTGALVVDGGVGIAKDLHLGGDLFLGGTLSSGSGGATEILENTVETNTFIGDRVESTCDLEIYAGCDMYIAANDDIRVTSSGDMNITSNAALTIEADDVFEINATGATNSVYISSANVDVDLRANNGAVDIDALNLNIDVDSAMTVNSDFDILFNAGQHIYVNCTNNFVLNSNASGINGEWAVALESPSGAVTLDAGSRITLDASEEITITSNSADGTKIVTNGETLFIDSEKTFIYNTETQKTQGETLLAAISETPRLHVHTNTLSPNILISRNDLADTVDEFIAFWGTNSLGTEIPAGRIRGSDAEDPAFISGHLSNFEANDTGSIGQSVKTRIGGDVVYASGAADFGEWIECGDLLEWEEYQKKENKKIPNQVCLPEGIVVTIRNGKFYKEGSGCKALITNSALLVGNEGGKSEDWYGSIISFAGQIHVYIEGSCKSGDYIVPEDNKNYCIAIDKDEISFSDYKNALGTVLEDSEGEGFKRILCAIGIK